jgi:putative ABC transport system permease protein
MTVANLAGPLPTASGGRPPPQAGEVRTGWSAWLPLRFAMREMRSGLRGFYVFIACIALGTMAIAGVGSLASSLADGLAKQGSVILGGDVSFSLTQREANPQELQFLTSRGTVSIAATMRAMLRLPDGRASLAEVKAIDSAYPLTGEVKLNAAMSLASAIAAHDGVYGAALDPILMTRFDLKPGDRFQIGDARFVARGTIETEPDKLAVGLSFGPRVLVSIEALRATGLLQPGSIVHWLYRVRLPAGATPEQVDATADAARTAFPEAGWQIRTRNKATPQIERDVDRFTQFLTIVGLTALLVGGVGVGNAIKSHLDRRRDSIATLKAVGASGRTVFAIYLVQTMLLALVGGIIGVTFGAVLPYAVFVAFKSILPLPIDPSFYPMTLGLALVYGLLTALAFALWPLGRAHDVPVGALFRDEVAPLPRWPRPGYIAMAATATALLAGLAVLLAYDRRVATIYVAAAAGIFVLLRLVALVLMAIAARLPHARRMALRMAVANIHRPGALTPTVVLSLGLGIALLVTVVEIDANLRQQFAHELPEKAPSFFFLDIPSNDSQRFAQFVQELAPAARVDDVPMLRGRIISAKGIPAEQLRPKDDTGWVLQSDRGITYSDSVPEGSRLVAGEWWPADYDGPPLVSFEKRIADGLGLTLGDSITVNILGRNITAKIANIRRVDWESLSINFVMVFSPNTVRGAPHTHLATMTLPGGGSAQEEGNVLRALAQNFPMVSAVRVKDALDALASLVANLLLAIRGASGLTLVAAALVLGGALAAGHRHRVYDAVILKTLGATRARLLAAYSLEYALLGFATAVFAVLAGSLAGWAIVAQIMHLRFTWLPWPALGAAAAAVIVTVVLGLAGTYRALGQKPASVLRNF